MAKPDEAWKRIRAMDKEGSQEDDLHMLATCLVSLGEVITEKSGHLQERLGRLESQVQQLEKRPGLLA